MELMPGSYIITYNEIVHIPTNLMALARPRSSLLRCGVNIGTAVWDAGYSGRSQSLMLVYNSSGFRVQKNARVAQLIFMPLTTETDGYSGKYQNENIYVKYSIIKKQMTNKYKILISKNEITNNIKL